ncbi:MAG: FxLYD domain-containing protein [Burkholderiales bacterium]|nr:FxLYD domain-containing protein [Burkholderiales bacterium]
MTNGFARRVAHGFAFGLGFAVAAALGWLVVREFGALAGEVGNVVAGGTPRKVAAEQAGIFAHAGQVRVASHRIERRNGDVVVLGLLHNDADAAVRSVRVEAAYYDAAGRLVDLCGWYVATSLAPGEEKPFKVACGGTPERPAPESASVRLRIVEGF